MSYTIELTPASEKTLLKLAKKDRALMVRIDRALLALISGQTPRNMDGTQLKDASIEEQTRQTLDNLSAIAQAAELSLNDAVKVTVYLKELTTKQDLERIYCEYISEPAPARIVVQSSFIDFDIEIDAILQVRH